MDRKLFISVCVAALGLSALKAGALEPQFAEDAWAQAMSLRDCMEYAISNSTKVRIQQAETGDARIARRDALLSTFLPAVSTGTSMSSSFGRNIDPETNTYINTMSFSNGYSLSASINLFNGFSAVNNLKISQTSLKMGETREKQAEADICLAVMEAYYNVLYYKRICDIYEEMVTAAETSLIKARRQEELGQKGHADVVQMEADLASRQYDMTNAQNMYRSQMMTLEDLMFWPMDEELVIETDVRPFADAIEPASEQSVVDFALANDPAVKLASWSVDNARLELNTAKWQLLPSVSLGGGWSTSYYSYMGAETMPYMDMLKRNGGEYLSMSVNVPIFNRLSRRSNVARHRNALEKASATLDQTRRDVESEVRRAVQDRDGAATAWRLAQRNAEVQEEAYNLNLKKLEQGLISPLEFQTADNNYLKAMAEEMNSRFKYLIKDAVVQYYGGVEYVNQ